MNKERERTPFKSLELLFLRPLVFYKLLRYPFQQCQPLSFHFTFPSLRWVSIDRNQIVLKQLLFPLEIMSAIAPDWADDWDEASLLEENSESLALGSRRDEKGLKVRLVELWTKDWCWETILHVSYLSSCLAKRGTNCFCSGQSLVVKSNY